MAVQQFEVYLELAQAYSHRNYTTGGYKAYHDYCGKKMQRIGRLIGKNEQLGKTYNPFNWEDPSTLQTLTSPTKQYKFLEYLMFQSEKLWATSQLLDKKPHFRLRAIKRAIESATVLERTAISLISKLEDPSKENVVSAEGFLQIQTYLRYLKCESSCLLSAPQYKPQVDMLFSTIESLTKIKMQKSNRVLLNAEKQNGLLHATRQHEKKCGKVLTFIDLKVVELSDMLNMAPSHCREVGDLSVSLEGLKTQSEEIKNMDTDQLVVSSGFAGYTSKITLLLNNFWPHLKSFHNEITQTAPACSNMKNGYPGRSKRRSDHLWRAKSLLSQVEKNLESWRSESGIASNVFLTHAMDSRLLLIKLLKEYIQVIKLESLLKLQDASELLTTIKDNLASLMETIEDQASSLEKVGWTLEEQNSIITLQSYIPLMESYIASSTTQHIEAQKAKAKSSSFLHDFEKDRANSKPIFYDLALDRIQYPSLPAHLAPETTESLNRPGLGNILKKWWGSS